jgi:hypothetical protein
MRHRQRVYIDEASSPITRSSRTYANLAACHKYNSAQWMGLHNEESA